LQTYSEKKLYIIFYQNFITYSENPPPESNAITFLSVISFVVGSTKYPEHSRPNIYVTPFGGGYFPLDFN
jgi:hypothetical protein